MNFRDWISRHCPTGHLKEAAYKIISKNVPNSVYHVIKGISHYQAYEGKPYDEATKVTTEFFVQHLKPGGASKL